MLHGRDWFKNLPYHQLQKFESIGFYSKGFVCRTLSLLNFGLVGLVFS